MRSIRIEKRLALVAFCLAMAALSGCRDGGGLGGGGGLLGGGGIFGGGRWGGDGPLAPGGGSSSPVDTPTWDNPMPDPGPRLKPPASPVTFSGDTQAILDRFNTQLTGADLNDQTLPLVLNALQLYRERQHSLTIVVERDDSRLPITAMWSTGGYDAMIEFFQPELQHTISHEVAHDMTLLAYEAEGQQFTNTILQFWGDDGTWPSGYAQTNEHEAMAEILSFLAEYFSQLPTDEQPWNSFNPATPIIEDAKMFMADNVRSAAGK